MATLRERLTSLRAPRAGRTAELYVSAGSVACPERGDVPIELCLACPHLREVDGDPVRRIECRPGGGAMMEIARQPIY